MRPFTFHPPNALTRRQFQASLAASVAAVLTHSAISRAEEPKRKRILIANAWHCINIGDIAHGPGLFQLLQAHVPEADITLWPVPSTRPGYDRELAPEVRTMLERHFPGLTILKAGDGHSKGPATRPDLVAAIAQADLFIVGSGGMHEDPLHVWRATTDKPYGVYGVSLNKLSGARTDLLSKAAFIYARDSVSTANLEQAGVTCPHRGFGPDAVFGFTLRDDERALPYLQKHGLEEGRFLCVIPRHRTSPYHTMYGYAPTDEDREVDRINAEFAASDHATSRALITHWVRTTGLKVLACPEMTYGVPLAKEHLVDPLPDDVKPHVVWRDSFWMPDEAASIFARARAVVSLDCHSPIIALAAGTPSIHLRVPTDNPFKSRMFADIGLPEWVHELEGMTNEKLIALVTAIHEQPEAAAAKVGKAMAFVKKRQSETMTAVRAALAAP